MRSFVISVIIVILCLGISTANCIWTKSRIDTLTADAAHLTKSNIEDFITEWQKTEAVLAFTSRQVYIREIEDALGRLYTALEMKDSYETEAAREALIYKMKELCISQCFDLKSIL